MDKKIIIESAIFAHLGLIMGFTNHHIIAMFFFACAFSTIITPCCITSGVYKIFKDKGGPE
jgi:hypothetical protein